MVDDLDRLLATDENIAPSPGFSAAVMRAVRREATLPPPIPIPWRRPAVLTGAGVLLTALARDLLATAPLAPLALLAAALIGSYLVARYALRCS